MKFFKCSKCGTIVEEIKLGGCHPSCCGEPMTELVAGSVDAAREKHIPVVTIEGNKVHAEVGSAAHPMLEVHYIEWIAFETNKGLHRINLTYGEAPKADLVLAEGEELLRTYAYCNLHALWVA